MRKNKSELEKELVYKPIYLPVRFFKKEAYIHIDDYKEAINKRENAVNGLEEENKKLKEEIKELRKNGEYYHRDNCQLRDEIMKCKDVNGELNEEIDKLKETIKDHQLYEEKLEHRIIEFEELLHGE